MGRLRRRLRFATRPVGGALTSESGMGVRFECPNGHKLHVKAHLAGQRGICPECHVRFIVPSFSGGRVAEAAPGGGSSSDLVSAAIESPSSFDAGLAPPTAREDDVQWYVRPESGGQFGPVDTAAFKQWVAEGRVGADAWVWRTGWPEWRAGNDATRALKPPRRQAPPPAPAPRSASRATRPLTRRGASTPALSSKSTPAASKPTPSLDVGDLDLAKRPSTNGELNLTLPTNPARTLLLRRRKANQRLTLVLSALALVLLVVLVAVMTNRGKSGDSDADNGDAAPPAASSAADVDGEAAE